MQKGYVSEYSHSKTSFFTIAQGFISLSIKIISVLSYNFFQTMI